MQSLAPSKKRAKYSTTSSDEDTAESENGDDDDWKEDAYNAINRKVFTKAEDMKIIRFLLDNQNIGTGVPVWKLMEEEEIVPGRKWTSLRRHYLYLKDSEKLKNYNLTAEEQEYLIHK